MPLVGRREAERLGQGVERFLEVILTKGGVPFAVRAGRLRRKGPRTERVNASRRRSIGGVFGCERVEAVSSGRRRCMLSDASLRQRPEPQKPGASIGRRWMLRKPRLLHHLLQG